MEELKPQNQILSTISVAGQTKRNTTTQSQITITEKIKLSIHRNKHSIYKNKKHWNYQWWLSGIEAT